MNNRGLAELVVTPFSPSLDVRNNIVVIDELLDRLYHIEGALRIDTSVNSRLINQVREALPHIDHHTAVLVLAANFVFFDNDTTDEEAER